jgi:restriction system protein
MSEGRETNDEIRRLIELPRAEFESLVANLYRALGHQAMRTNAKESQAAHVLVKAANGQKWIVQCRQWRGAVGETVVREFLALMEHEQAAQGAIITTAKFTPRARDRVKGKPLHLYDGDEFVRAVQRIQSRKESGSRVVK